MTKKIGFSDLNLRLKIIVVWAYAVMLFHSLLFLYGLIIGLVGL